MATGIYALTLPFTFSEPWPVLVLAALAALVLLVLRLPRFANTGLGTTLHGVERKSYGELLLALSVGFIFYFSVGKIVLYVLPIAVLTLSDAAAALIGTRYGRKHFAVEAGTKSLEGVAMFFMVTWILGMVLLLMTDIGRVNVVLLSLVIAAFGALVEADSWRGFDNLFVPVGIHLFLASHLETQPLQLLLLTTTFVVVLCGILLLAPVLRLLQSRGAQLHRAGVSDLRRDGAAQRHPAGGGDVRSSRGATAAALPERLSRSRFSRRSRGAWRCSGCSSASSTAKNALNLYNLTFAGAALVLRRACRQSLPRTRGGRYRDSVRRDARDRQLESNALAVARHALAVGRRELRALPGRACLLARLARSLPRAARAGTRLAGPARAVHHRVPAMSNVPDHYAIDGAACRLFRDAPSWDGQRTAAIGAFHCDSAVTGARLLGRAAEALKAEGFEAMIGPMDGDTWHRYRLVAETDNSPPFLLEPVSGAHDQAAFEAAGFTPISHYVSTRAPLDAAIGQEGAVRIDGVTVTPWDGRDADVLIGRLFDMSAAAFSRNAFFKPITKADFFKLYEPVLPAIEPAFVLVRT